MTRGPMFRGVRLGISGHLDAGKWCIRQSGASGSSVGKWRTSSARSVRAGGQWYLDYAEGERDDELGFRLGEERFVVGEYVSIGHKGVMHTSQMARVEHP